MLKCSFHTSLPHTKIMDLSYLFYKCLNTAWHKWRPNAPNFKYSAKPLPLQQQQLLRIILITNNWEIADSNLNEKFKVFPYMAMHNKKALSGLVLFKTIHNTEKQKNKENVWRRESWIRNGLVGLGRGVVGPRLSGLVQLPNQTSRDYSWQSGLLRGERIIGAPCPTSKIFTSPEWGKGLRKSLWTPHTHPTLS